MAMLIIANFSLAQHQRPSTTAIDKDKYCGPTKWSCIDKHYGYYFLSYAMPIPVSSGNSELEGRSGKLRVGYSYRYKIAKPFDIGVELNYARRSTGLIFDSVASANPSCIKQKFSEIGHAIEGDIFFRFNFGKSDFRHLGWHIDIGANYSYDFACIDKYVSISNSNISHAKSKLKIRDKNAQFRNIYGVFMRIGWNYIAITCSYDLADWNFNGFERSPLMIGLELNLYTR